MLDFFHSVRVVLHIDLDDEGCAAFAAAGKAECAQGVFERLGDVYRAGLSLRLMLASRSYARRMSKYHGFIEEEIR